MKVTHSKAAPMIKQVSILNKILLAVEIIPVILMLLLSLLLLGSSEPVFFLTLVFSILSMISLIYLIINTMFNSDKRVANRFVYLAHLGVAITASSLLVILIDGNSFKELSPEAPFAIFSFGLVVCIPYLHVMLINGFYRNKDQHSNG